MDQEPIVLGAAQTWNKKMALPHPVYNLGVRQETTAGYCHTAGGVQVDNGTQWSA